MGRPKDVEVRTFAAGPSDQALEELQAGIHRLLVVANDDAQQSTPLAKDIHRVLALLTTGQAGRLDEWPGWAAVAFDNLMRLVRNGGYYVRRCPTCASWFVAKDKRRNICYSKACAQASARRRAAAARRSEREKQRRARVTAKGTPRTK